MIFLSYTVGIDLGTTNTVCCVFDNELHSIKFGREHMLPSILAYRNGKISIGRSAKNALTGYSSNVITSSKRFMGEDKVWHIDDMDFTPTSVAAEILKEVRYAAEQYFKNKSERDGKTFSNDEKIEIVITVPARFDLKQVEETKKAAQIAGFEVKRVLTEPVAAAIAYGLDNNVYKNIFVIDIGGGTFDLCLMDFQTSEKVKTIHIDGDNKLGGDDFDDVIVEMCYAYLRKNYGINLSDEKKSGLESFRYSDAVDAVKRASERAKIALSDSDSALIEIPNLCVKNGKIINLEYTITKEDFENEAMLLFNKIRRKIERFMKDLERSPSFIDKVLLVGGTMNIPYIQSYLKEFFGEGKVCCESDLSKLVAEGAAMMAAQDGTLLKIQVEDVLSYDLGIAAKSRSGENIFSVIIPKSTRYPVAITKKYSTAKDNQETIPIDVYEGESRHLEDNHKYGRITLRDFPKGPAGMPVAVEFSINEDKILNVKVVEQLSGKSKTEQIMLGYTTGR